MAGTHAHWTWHRVANGEKIVSDEAWVVRYDGAWAAGAFGTEL